MSCLFVRAQIQGQVAWTILRLYRLLLCKNPVKASRHYTGLAKLLSYSIKCIDTYRTGLIFDNHDVRYRWLYSVYIRSKHAGYFGGSGSPSMDFLRAKTMGVYPTCELCNVLVCNNYRTVTIWSDADP